MFMDNTLALIDWHDFRLFLFGFMEDGAVWLLVGFLAAIVALSTFAAEASLVMRASHRRRSSASWPLDQPESAIPKAPVGALMK